MIANRRLFFSALLLFTLTITLSLNFPHRYSLGDVLLQKLHIPTQFAGGFFTMGIFMLILLITAFVCLFHALEKWHIRIIILALFLLLTLPSAMITTYQTFFGKGIYAIEYNEEESYCTFDMANKDTLAGTCYLPFTNFSNDTVMFTVQFQESLAFYDDIPMVSLMNEEVPFSVALQPHETKLVTIHTLIDVSKMDEYVESGEANMIDIEISANGKSREL